MHRRICGLLAPCLLLVFRAPLPAQTFFCVTSIDSIAANSAEIFLGRVTSVRSTSSDSYGHHWTGAEFTPDEVLWGKPNGPFSTNVAIRDKLYAGLPTATPTAWRENHHRILVMVEDPGQEARWPALSTAIDLDQPGLSAWRADFVRIQTTSALLDAVRAEVERMKHSPLPLPSVCIDKPKDNYQGTLLDDTMTRGLTVPADDRMETRARGIIDGSIQTDYGEDAQYYAIEDLDTRPSPQVISLLMSLLKGPNHRLRWGAYESLTHMGKQVAPPN
jgi:hypothetical protein